MGLISKIHIKFEIWLPILKWGFFFGSIFIFLACGPRYQVGANRTKSLEQSSHSSSPKKISSNRELNTYQDPNPETEVSKCPSNSFMASQQKLSASDSIQLEQLPSIHWNLGCDIPTSQEYILSTKTPESPHWLIEAEYVTLCNQRPEKLKSLQIYAKKILLRNNQFKFESEDALDITISAGEIKIEGIVQIIGGLMESTSFDKVVLKSNLQITEPIWIHPSAHQGCSK